MAASSEPEVFGEKGAVGLVVIHDIFGRDDYPRSVGRELAAAGYPAAVIDLFDGRRPASLEEAMSWRSTLSDADVLAHVDAGRAAVERRLVRRARVGTLGFCMGGGYALLAGCRRPYDFVVDFYGKIESVADAAGLSGPVLLILASEDPRITPWAFSEFLPAANAAKKRVSVELYPGVEHAFHRPGSPRYHAASAAEAWARTLAFLRDAATPAPGGQR